jgi:hypothetical protein
MQAWKPPGNFPPEARTAGALPWFLGGTAIKNPLLAVREGDGLSNPVTLWHESLHYPLWRTRNNQLCLEEEAYMDLCETRIDWLKRLRSFDALYKARNPKTDPQMLQDRWKDLETNHRHPSAAD